MKEIPKYKVGDIVTIRKSHHEGCRESDYPFHFTYCDLLFHGGGKRVIKEVKEVTGYGNTGKVPFDGVYYILEGSNDMWSPYMFEESGDWRDGEEWKPKNGDIVTFGSDAIGIFEEEDIRGVSHKDYVTLSKGHVVIGEGQWTLNKIRPATEEERQKLFDAMTKEGKRWNAEKKVVEDIPPETEEKSLRYGGDIAGFPPEIVEKMLEYQEKQGNKRNVKVFEEDRYSCDEGFFWRKTDEGFDFWSKVIGQRDFDVFFKRYPKDNPEPIPDEVGISQDTADELDACIERLKDQIYDFTKVPCGFWGFYPSPGKIKANSGEPASKGRLYRKKKGFPPFGKVEKVKPVETKLHTKSK